jgi:hypothetical protein
VANLVANPGIPGDPRGPKFAQYQQVAESTGVDRSRPSLWQTVGYSLAIRSSLAGDSVYGRAIELARLPLRAQEHNSSELDQEAMSSPEDPVRPTRRMPRRKA